MSATGIALGGHPQGTGESFEARFDDVVRIDASELANMQGHTAVVDDRLVKFADELGVVGANPLGWDVEAKTEVGSSRKIEDHLDKGFVEGGKEMAKAGDTLAVAEGFGEGLAEDDPSVFVGVVIVDVQVAVGNDVEVEQAVGADLSEHVV